MKITGEEQISRLEKPENFSDFRSLEYNFNTWQKSETILLYGVEWRWLTDFENELWQALCENKTALRNQ